MVRRPLEGLRVLDLTRFVAGSQTTALLAAFGADVIKLEVPPGGDPYRVQGTERLGDESVLFLSLNSREAERRAGLPLARRRPRRSAGCSRRRDFVVENCATRQPRALRPGLGAASTRDTPRSCTARSPATATSGPTPARGGFDLILQAESGVMSVTGSEAIRAGEGRRAASWTSARGCAARSGCSPRTSSGCGPAWARTCRPRSWSSRWPRSGRSPRATFVSGEVPGLLGTHSPTFAPYGGIPDAGRVDRPRGGGLGGSVGALLRRARCRASASRIRDSRTTRRGSATATSSRPRWRRSLRTEPSAHWLALLDAEGVPAAEVQRHRAGVRGRAGACARRRAGAAPSASAGDHRVVGTAGAVRSCGVPVPVARRPRSARTRRASWPSRT